MTRSSYLAAAALALPDDARTIVTNREAMNRCYREDIRRDAPLNAQIPERPGGHSLRVVSWNINVLCGIAASNWVTRDGEAIEPEAAAAVVRALDADVLILQEAMGEPDHGDEHLPAACARVRKLDELLESQGYELHRGQGPGHGNHVLLATRKAAQVSSLDLDVGVWHPKVCAAGAPELAARVAVFARLRLAGKSLWLYGVHLFHRDGLPGTELHGARAAEMQRILEHAALGTADCHVIVGDFNQCRLSALTSDEARVVEHTATLFGNPLDDGVCSLLQAKGFSSCWDLPGQRNFEPGAAEPVAPPYTHWTGTTLDHGYLRSSSAAVSLAGAHVFFTELSDHLPIVFDILVDAEEVAQELTA